MGEVGVRDDERPRAAKQVRGELSRVSGAVARGAWTAANWHSSLPLPFVQICYPLSLLHCFSSFMFPFTRDMYQRHSCFVSTASRPSQLFPIGACRFLDGLDISRTPAVVLSVWHTASRSAVYAVPPTLRCCDLIHKMLQIMT